VDEIFIEGAAVQPQSHTLPGHVRAYPLLKALLNRRSRRFGAGMRLNGGPLAYASTLPPQPLTIQEEAALAFAGCGVTGYALAELPYESGEDPDAGGGNIMKQFLGRTAPSPDAAHIAAVFIMNDAGTYLLRRPQDFGATQIPGLIQAAREGKLTWIYEQSRVRIADRRIDIPRKLPYLPPFNRWSANVPGSTYFLPVSELTAIYINILLAAFSNDFAYCVFDDRNGFAPAGVSRFGRKHGGALHDDPQQGRFLTISGLEYWLCELAAIEVGAIAQNLGLMSQALGLGGFPHFAAHPYGWPEALSFRMEFPKFSQVAGLGALQRSALKLLRKDMYVPTPVGLEQNGSVLLKPFCPPYYRDMAEAVRALVDEKFAAGRGSFRDGGANTAWRDGRQIQAVIPSCSDTAVEATIACCDYIYRRYGRFPSVHGPFRTVIAYQAHHLDPAFYDRFYRAEEARVAPGY
jgi:hypothetical protein